MDSWTLLRTYIQRNFLFHLQILGEHTVTFTAADDVTQNGTSLMVSVTSVIRMPFSLKKKKKKPPLSPNLAREGWQ